MKLEVKKICFNNTTKQLDIELDFENVNDGDFIPVKSSYLKVGDFDVVLCHFKNKTASKVTAGNHHFKLDFECKNFPSNLTQTNIVWWNDDQPYTVEEMEPIILRIIVGKIASAVFEKENYTKAVEKINAPNIPRQGGNGGVLGITRC